ncbi:hypothetical protein MSG28_002411 [Choristoneura fumiferana]|uniref:Uncharacterized protein n=1 Tax=Choristoneura fumiferana TaxID=7141 RepID=A0ACC0JVK4_CHOFU|nr:hypothetical protein MSG28_002411 [Choristoneura fumiferana]
MFLCYSESFIHNNAGRTCQPATRARRSAWKLAGRQISPAHLGLHKQSLEYSHLLYRQTVPINGTPVELEVIDVSGSNSDKFPAEQIQWADACLVVYSVTDRSSFEYATEVLTALRRTPTSGSPAHGPAGASAPMPLALLGNKTDLDHLRQVTTTDGQSASAAHNASFSEASVADNSGDLYRCVDRLLAEVRTPLRTRKFSVTKMLGSLIGNLS